MEEIIALTEQLQDTFELIKKAHINSKKAPKVRLTPGFISTRIQIIEDYWKSFKENHATLIKLTSSEQRKELPYFVNGQYDECEEEYLSVISWLRDTATPNVAHSLAAGGPSGTAQGTASSVIVERAVEVALPRIDLPKYSGSYENWQSFEDTFISLIHNNKNLSNVQRMHYLKSCLLGEASAAIKQYQVTDNNYQAAWDTLKARYSHKRLIVNAILKRLFSQKKIMTQSPGLLKTLVDTTNECLIGLKNLKITIESWDPIIIFLFMQKLDPETHKDWEDHVSSNTIYEGELPSFADLVQFIERIIQTLELTSASPSVSRSRVFHIATETPQRSCLMCQEGHALYHCKKFCSLHPDERMEFVRKVRCCFNCLIPGHSVHFCKQKLSCRICKRRHHSLLHQRRKTSAEYQGDVKPSAEGTSSEAKDNQGDLTEMGASHVAISSHHTSKQTTSLLATALVPIRDDYGNTTILRALVDMGSQATFISERATQLLKVKRTPVMGSITGVGSTKTKVNQLINIEVLSRCDSSFHLSVVAYVMPTRLTTMLPTTTITFHSWPHIQGLVLADPRFYQPGRIDLLLGVEMCAQIFKEKIIRGPPSTPSAQDTRLGWILFGEISENKPNVEFITLHHHLRLNDIMKSMWELEPTTKRVLTKEEKLCEEIYEKTHSRTEEGRYIVKLPLKTEIPLSTEGNTRELALKRLYQVEKRLERKPTLKEEYARVFSEYLSLNHIEQVPKIDLNKPSVYLPHHAVVREDKETSKVRVVFDASAKGTNKISLNDELLVGPQLQEDLRNLIMRWRLKRLGFVADVEKMYRQILVTKKDADFQRVLWRKSPEDEIIDYRLLRVTFGTASAPFLAVRTLNQIADDEGKEYPEAVKVIKEDFLMDDLLSGEDTDLEAIELANTIKSILRKGGLKLTKWSSNSLKFVEAIDPSERSAKININFKVDGIIKALGISWNMYDDSFQYQHQISHVSETLTKRVMLSEIQRLFDPLGWLVPALIPAKLMMQQLWQQGLDWDDEVQPEIKEKWLNLHNELTELNQIKLKRWMYTTKNTLSKATIHGFCDSSTKAYAAVAYLRVETEVGEVKTGIIAAKGRVAPIKPVSLPRLELCGAVLLSRLLKQVTEATRIPMERVYAWADSSVVLSWLIGDPARWNVFVSNRVVEIIDNVGSQRWFHVSSEDNPADLASRGTSLHSLKLSKMWWKGPMWLQLGESEIPFKRPKIKETKLELKKTLNVNVKVTEDKENRDFIKFEDFNSVLELQKTIAFAKRFLNYKRCNKLDTYLTTKELDTALEIVIKYAQKKEFQEDIDRLKEGKPLSSRSNLKPLNPILDDFNLLRVGGRLSHANIPERTKYPIIIGHKSALVPLLIAESHKNTLHGGIQLMLSYLRSRYWIIRAKPLIRAYIHKCLVCARHQATNREQLMGSLPKVRVTPARPFLNSGVDFAGPFQVLISRSRGAKCYKAYISLFICMATKAIHLELVGDLTSQSFLGAFRRFVARRGKCANIWSDQGTNFIGANKELHELWQAAKLEIPGELVDVLSQDGTQWHFNPPYSPNFGGLWEAGVKSIKYHLKRILNTMLTFEEMTTILCQIEACLNSRPLCPVDNQDIDNLDILTPGHFLIGEAPISIPEPSLREVNINRLSRWQYTQRLFQDFWHRWRTEYLCRLQERPKWQRQQKEFSIGDIVLLKEDNLPPGKWAMGRILHKHPGDDGICRVYSIKYGGKIVKRSIAKICALPIND